MWRRKCTRRIHKTTEAESRSFKDCRQGGKESSTEQGLCWSLEEKQGAAGLIADFSLLTEDTQRVVICQSGLRKWTLLQGRWEVRAPVSSSHGPSRLSHPDHRRRPRHPVPGVGMGAMCRGLRRDLSLMLSPAHAHATHAWMEKDLLLSPCHIIPVGFFPASSSRRQGPLLHPLCLLSSRANIRRITRITWHQPLVSYAEPICWKSLLAPQHLFEPPSPSQLSAAVRRGAVGGGPGGSPPHRPGSPTGIAHPAALPTTDPPRWRPPTRPLARLSESG